MNRRKHSPGFTLIEIIITIAIIAAIVAIVFVALRPQERLQDAQVTQEKQTAEQMTRAINLQIIDTFAIPDVPDQSISDICKAGVSPVDPENEDNDPCISLDNLVSQGYLPDIPETVEYKSNTRISGYQIVRSGGYVAVCRRGECSGGGGGGTGAGGTEGGAGGDSGPQMGSTLAFSPGTAAVSVPYAPSFDFDIQDSFSISFWMKMSGTPSGTVGLIGRHDTRGYHIDVIDGQKIAIRYEGVFPPTGDSNSVVALYGQADAFTPGDTDFHHVLVTYSVPTEAWSFGVQTAAAKIFIDGTNIGLGSTFDPFYAIGSMDFVGDLRFGARFAVPEIQSGNVTLDDVRFYSRDLSTTPGDIAILSDQNATNDASVSNLVHHWDFNQTTGTTVPDVTGGSDGQLIGSPLPTWSSEAPF